MSKIICTLDNIFYWEPRETRFTVNAEGEPDNELETEATGYESNHPWSCSNHGRDFATWAEVKKHLTKFGGNRA